jgi:hypothetical protein
LQSLSKGKALQRGEDDQVGQKLAECTASGGLCKESNEKVNATIKYNQVCTVSDGGRMERRSAKPIKAAKKWKTPRVYRIGRPLGGE